MDDKARAPIGTTLANKQTAVSSGLQSIRSSGHDFPNGPSHAFIVSAYRAYIISEYGQFDDYKRVSWSGPGVVYIRSAYHENQSAYNHCEDIIRFLDHPRFTDYLKTDGS